MSDEIDIKATLQAYCDCMLESSAEKANTAFHSNAKVTGHIGSTLHEMTAEAFVALVASQQPSPKEKGETLLFEVLSIETAGKTAVARVRDSYQGTTYLDTLSLIKDEGRWSIYTKLFHVEGTSS